MENRTTLCRCSDVTLEQVRDLIKEGYEDIEEIKRLLRVGMGRCQGKTCTPLLIREVAIITGKRVDQILPSTYRPPVKSIRLGAISDAAGGDLHE